MPQTLQPSVAAPNTLDLATAIAGTPQADFHSDRYLRNTARRLEHLASLGLDLDHKRVLEVGAGIGDLTTFFLDRGCTVHATEGREGNFDVLRARYANEPNVSTALLDLDPPPAGFTLPGERGYATFDVVFCYGLLYHLSRPDLALDFLANATGGDGDTTDAGRGGRGGVLLLESIVKPAGVPGANPWAENAELAGSAVSGMGSRPSRVWVWEQLRARFPHVYVPTTQPRHAEFPIDWTLPGYSAATRAIFIASHTPLNNPLLSSELVTRQTRH